ncbi:MAG TPA: EAL domain-containing protein [Acidimicrobiia bacterium]
MPASSGLLEEVAVAANEATCADAALQLAVARVCAHTGWPVGHALRREPDGELRSGGIWYVAAGFDADAFVSATSAAHLQAGVGLPGRVLATRKPAWIADLVADGNFPRFQAATAAGLKSGFAFPVYAGPDVVGVLEFYSATIEAPQPALLDVMANVGVQLGRVFERDAAAAALEAEERRIRDVLDNAADAFIATDAEGRITGWNAAAEYTFGWSRDEVDGLLVADVIVPPSLRDAHNAGMARFRQTGKAQVLGNRLELPARHRDGHELPIEIPLWALNEVGAWSYFAFARDITTRKQAEDDLEHQALHDSLTGLPNRALLMENLRRALSRRDREGVGVLFADLDGFKRINDSLGHDAGDELLVAFAHRASELVRPSDTVARLAGDEFVIVCESLDGRAQAAVLAQRLCDALAEPFELAGDSVFVSASIGAVVCEPGSDTDADALIAAADVAMYHSKTTDRGRFVIFDEHMRQQVTTGLRLETDLRHAVQRGELRLFYQPVIDVTTEAIVGVEALLRWQHPKRGLLSPAEFIPIAEASGLIVGIGEWVLEEVCRQAREWEPLLDAPIELALNISARQLAQSNFVAKVARILSESAVDPERMQIGLEITESILMRDPETAAHTLRELHALGLKLAIDDFGTGYSSLAYLKQFPVDTVKVDQSFVAGLGNDPVDRAIVHAIIELAHALDITTVAEGVETPAQHRHLRALGADFAQGFLFARPQPAARLTAALQQSSKSRRASA